MSPPPRPKEEPPKNLPSRLAPWESVWPFLRDVILFVVGVAGMIFEAGFVDNPNPAVLMVFAAFCGVPIALSGFKK